MQDAAARGHCSAGPPRSSNARFDYPSMNHSVGMLCLYAGAAFLASLAGGWLPSLVRLTHTRLQTALSFIAGLMLGIALLHLIPHAAVETHSVDRAVAWVLGGFLALFFLQRVFHYHQHGLPVETYGSGPAACCGHGAGSAPVAGHKLSWTAVAVGLAVSILVGAFEGHDHGHRHDHGHDHGEAQQHAHPHPDATAP